MVSESLPELVDLVREFRAGVIGQAQELDYATAPQHRPVLAEAVSAGAAVSTVVPLHREDR